MEQRRLGATPAMVPELGIGTYFYAGTSELLRQGIDLGAAFVDTAELYGNEEVVGRAVRGIRDRVFVATKTHHFTYREILQCAEASLLRLGIDTIDLYQLHHANGAVPIAETMGAMEELVRQGKVRYLGVSNFTVPELAQAEAALGKHRLASNQMRYNVVDRTVERDVLPWCREHGVTLLAYSPLGHDFRRLLAADSNRVLSEVARETRKSEAQVALNWCLDQPGVVALFKTESAAHMRENCGSSGWRLTPEQKARLDRGIPFRCRGRLAVALRRVARRTAQKMRGR